MAASGRHFLHGEHGRNADVLGGTAAAIPSDYYAWNTSTEAQWGTLLPLGSMWGSSIAAQDASGKTLAQELTAPLTVAQQSNVQGTSCVNIGPDSYGYTYQTCSALDYETIVTSGTFAF